LATFNPLPILEHSVLEEDSKMCCFFTALVFFGPRLGFLVYWLIAPIRVSTAFAAFNLSWLVGILGLIFIPWTSLMYVMIFPLNGFDWLWLGLGLAADIFSYVGSYHNRQRVPGYPENDPLATM
jgi:hypothetical protein